MSEMAIYTRSDGLLEPRSNLAIDWVKAQKPGQMVLIKVLQNQRSAKQNRYLNGWIYAQLAKMLCASGLSLNGHPWTRNNLHAAFQELYLVEFEYNFMGKEITVYESTASMSKKRFFEYIDEQIRPFSRETWGIEIPEPMNNFYAELLRDIR